MRPELFEHLLSLAYTGETPTERMEKERLIVSLSMISMGISIHRFLGLPPVSEESKSFLVEQVQTVMKRGYL